MEELAKGSESVLDCVLFHARSSRGKVLDYIASVQGKTNHPLSQTLFRSSDGDNSLKRRKSFLER
jgi:cation transport ATPase